MAESTTFVRQELLAAVPPPGMASGLLLWLRQRLFGTLFNSVLTLVSVAVVLTVLWPTLRFLVIDAVWSGASLESCVRQVSAPPIGACWPFITAKLNQFAYGAYPAAEQWRVVLTY